MSVTLKSAWLPGATEDGARYLAETLWPEGVDTHGLSPYRWVPELAPSYEMKETAEWKHWSPEKFRDEYRRELQEPERRMCFNALLKEAAEKGITLLHRSRKRPSEILPEDTPVYYLKEFFDEALQKRSSSAPGQSPAAKGMQAGSGDEKASQRWANEGGQ